MMSFGGYWAKNYFMKVHAYSENDALNLMQIYWVTYLFSCLFVSYFVTSIRHCIKLIKFLALISMLAFFTLSLPYLFTYFSLKVLVIFAGISTAGIPIGFSIVALSVPKHMTGVSISINNTFLVLGGFLGQVLFGVAIHIFSHNPLFGLGGMTVNYYYALCLLPISAVIAFLALFVGFRRHPF